SFGDSFPTIEVIDLESGKSVGVWPTLRETKLAALRADGKVVAIQSDRLHSNTKGRLDIYSLGSEPKFQVGFVPFQEINPEHRDVHWVEFIGTKYLATSGGWPDRDLYVWELPSCRAVWKTPLARQAQPAVSPGRRQIAVSDENGIAILNAETGDLI